MMMDVRLLEATLDEVQDVLDAETNARMVKAIREAVNVTCMELAPMINKVREIVGEG